MERGTFVELLRKRVFILDGAYGTLFQSMGSGKVPGELLNLQNPDIVRRAYGLYLEAGADILLSNTFQGNRIKLAEFGAADRHDEINRLGVALALEAAATKKDGAGPGGRALVLGDITSTSNFPAPFGKASMEELETVFGDQAAAIAAAGADAIIIETMTDIKEFKAAVLGIRGRLPAIPIIGHMTFDENGLSLTGTSVEIFAAVADDLDVDAVGVNCSLGPDQLLPVFKRLAARTSKPLCVEPNAGKPEFDGQKTSYKMGPEDFGRYVEDFADCGASIIGGCCGSGPEHVRAMARMLGNRVARPRSPEKRSILASRNAAHDLSEFCVIGERINPASRKPFQAELEAGTLETVYKDAHDQAEEGACALDVNFGVEKTLKPGLVAEAIRGLDKRSSLPLSLDIQTPELLEEALREYPGRALVNSSSCDPEDLGRKLALVKKYGGVLVLLSMARKIPETSEERIQTVQKALEAIKAAKLSRERVLVDPLVLSIGAGKDPQVTLDTIGELACCGLKTTVGLSNLSFGMPERSSINAAFLAQAVARGLSSAIMNPGDSVVMSTLKGALLIKNGRSNLKASSDIQDPLVRALLSGKSKEVSRIVDAALAQRSPIEVSQDLLGKAMEDIGVLYETKKIFLPHLLFAAETAFPIFDYLNAKVSGESSSRGTVLLATVEGDVHDIGKNIIATVLRAGGFTVIDAGKDKSPQAILDEARALRPDIIGLSAMMTTTVGKVGETKAGLEAAGMECPVIAGGASMNEGLARRFSVHYCSNGSEALALCKALVADKS
jgi:5-methyltetrahydrofolate--homocysteine methyltransferase